MTFNDLESQKKLLELAKMNYMMAASVPEFLIYYQTDYLNSEKIFLQLGRAYYKNPELDINTLYENYEQDAKSNSMSR